MKLGYLARFAAFALCAVALTGCGTLNQLAGGSSEPSVSPRTAVLKAADVILPAMDEVAIYISAGAVSNNVVDDIVQYGPDVAELVSEYFDGAEACVVIGGQLVTETATGRECRRDPLNAIYDAVDARVRDWAIKTGLDTKEGQQIYAARLVIKLVPRPVASGPFPGYRDEPDVPLDDFRAMRAKARSSFEALLGAAQAAQARLKK